MQVKFSKHIILMLQSVYMKPDEEITTEILLSTSGRVQVNAYPRAGGKKIERKEET